MAQVPQVEPVVDEERTCPECKGSHLVMDDVRGELVCDDCGLVLQEQAVDRSPEWTAYTPDEARRRAHTGAPRDPLAGASSLTTIIPTPHRDAQGNPIPFEGRGALYRIQRLQRHASHAMPGERSIPTAARILDRFVSLLDLPRNVRDEAGFICRKAIQRGLARGRSMEVLVAAAIYAACRVDGVPRTLDELQRVTGLPKTRVGAAFRSLHRELSLAVQAPQSAEYIQRFCSELELSAEVEREAARLLREFEPPGTSTSVSPCGTAGAAIYLACLATGESRSEKAVSRVAGVSEVTLRNRYLEMKPLLPGITSPRGRTRPTPIPRA